jgi:hypothetical protein
MAPRSRPLLATVLLVACGFALVSAGVAADPATVRREDAASQARRFCEESLGGELWSRTELYFGLSRSGGPEIGESEFEEFLDTVVTPRFPDGLTLLSGDGQFRDGDGAVAKERSKLLILFYPWSNARSRAIERIRAIYKRDFQQQSVLRVDSTSCVSF